MWVKSTRIQLGIVLAELAQLVEHATENRSVRGPIPRLGTTTTPEAVIDLSTSRMTGKGGVFCCVRPVLRSGSLC